MYCGRRLAHLRLPFGSLWLPFAPLWLTAGSLWLPLGSLWHPFGSLLPSVGSLLQYPGLILHNFMYFRRKYRAKPYFYTFFVENHILGQPNRIWPKRVERTPTELTSSL